MALPPQVADPQRYTTVTGEANVNVATVTGASAFATLGVDNAFTMDRFRKGAAMKVTAHSEERLEFEMKGVDLSVANALRRIMIAEVPTVAIENVLVRNNTSVIQDEVLAHRLGLVPIFCDPTWLEWRDDPPDATEKNTVVFRLVVECTVDEYNKVHNDKVYTSALEWLPNGSELGGLTGEAKEYTNFKQNQRDFLKSRGWSEERDGPLRPVQTDILLCKLRPKQRIELEAHCVIGVGKDHAKFSPVATAWYRLYPSLHISERDPVEGEDAKVLVDEVNRACGADCGYVTIDRGAARVVGDVRDDFKAHELFRQLGSEGSGSRFERKLSVKKDKELIIFTVETAGQLAPRRIVKTAIDILRKKANALFIEEDG